MNKKANLKKKSGSQTSQVTVNRKARHDYSIERRLEAGLVLQGWEVKSCRAHKVQIADSYVIIKQGEAWLIGSHITPLVTASTHITPDVQRSRKLLLHKKELAKLIGAIDQKGFTLVPLVLYWKQNRLKLEIALVTGKKKHDKRAASKERDWQRNKQRIFQKNIS